MSHVESRCFSKKPGRYHEVFVLGQMFNNLQDMRVLNLNSHLDYNRYKATWSFVVNQPSVRMDCEESSNSLIILTAHSGIVGILVDEDHRSRI